MDNLFATDNPPLPEGSGNWVMIKAKRRKFIRKKSRKTALCREIVSSKNFILPEQALARGRRIALKERISVPSSRFRENV